MAGDIRNVNLECIHAGRKAFRSGDQTRVKSLHALGSPGIHQVDRVNRPEPSQKFDIPVPILGRTYQSMHQNQCRSRPCARVMHANPIDNRRQLFDLCALRHLPHCHPLQLDFGAAS
jgi:hypothetical protein